MQKVIGVLFTVLFIFTLATGARAEVREDIVVDGESLIVYKIAVVETKTEAERYPLPKFAASGQGASFSKIRDIMKAGQGEYVLDKKAERTQQWGFPMQTTTREVKTVAVFQNGAWSEPKVLVGPITTEANWALTVLLVIIAIGVLVMSLEHKKSGRSEWWLLGFYGALSVIMGSIFISNGAASLVFVFATTSLVFVFATTTLAFVFAATTFLAFVFAAVVAIATIATSATNNQIVEYAIFMACVIIVSYLLAKLAKRLGWIKVAELPAS